MIEKAHEGGPEIDIDVAPTPRPSRHVTGKTPESVAIVAMGPSQRIWHNGNGSYDRGIPQPAEVWALNKGLRTLKADVAFILDDLVGEARRSEQYAADIRGLSLPIITSTIDHDVRQLFPGNRLHAFPLQDIIWEMGIRFGVVNGTDVEHIIRNPGNVLRIGHAVGYYMQNSIPMILAYALWIGVRRVYLYGVDYTYPGQEAREDDRANCEYWVGFCRGQGLEVQVCADSTLLDTRKPPQLYGYGARPPVLVEPKPEDIRGILRHLGVIE
jgi:hypothetical protein